MLKQPEDFSNPDEYIKYALGQIGLVPTVTKMMFFMDIEPSTKNQNALVEEVYKKFQGSIRWN